MADDYKKTIQKKATDEQIKQYLAWLQQQGVGHSIENANKYKSTIPGAMGKSIFDQKVKRWEMDQL